jgi:predicted NAD/FAD-binding protein
MQIAVIGGGIAGLAAAQLLSRHHRVTLFERHAQPGFTAASVTLPEGQRVDVPLRVFYRGYYPTLTRLYAAAGVATEPVDYATTFTDESGRAYFRWRNLRWRGRAWAYVLPQDLRGARARHIALAAWRFQREARAAWHRGTLRGQSLDAFCRALALPEAFVQGLLLPVVATIATCTTADARAYPAEVVAGYLLPGLARESVHRAQQGADDVAQRLLAGLARLQCEAGVQGLRSVEVGVEGGGVAVLRQGGIEERFDHAVLATQANQAAALWLDATPVERQTLAAFRYRPLEVLMHRDPALMPPRRADWSPVNAWVAPGCERPESTIWLNRVQPALRDAAPLFQTVQPQRAPREDLVLARARFERPLVDGHSAAALAALQALHAQPGRRVWLAGSYAREGVPLLESAVRSAAEVAAAIDGRCALSGP